MFHRQYSRGLAEVLFAKVLLVPLLVMSLLVMVPDSHAHELNTVDNIKPSQTEPAIGNLPESTTINEEGRVIEENPYKLKKAQPSWWNWLTNASGKPAYFHYVDMIELLD